MAAPYRPQPRCIAVFIRRVDGNLIVTGVTPSIMRVYRGDEVIWDVICEEDGVEVSVVNFKPTRGFLPSCKPWLGDDAQRRAKTRKNGGTRIGDRVRGTADRCDLEYEIRLNNALALDPEIQIREAD